LAAGLAVLFPDAYRAKRTGVQVSEAADPAALGARLRQQVRDRRGEADEGGPVPSGHAPGRAAAALPRPGREDEPGRPPPGDAEPPRDIQPASPPGSRVAAARLRRHL